MAALTSVVYHNIGSDTEYEAGLNVTVDWQIFRDQIVYLSKNYDVIDLETLLHGRLPRRPLLITFDDCFASSFEAARNVLSPMGLPSVFFINPGLLGPEAISIDSLLAWCANVVGLDGLCKEIGVTPQSDVGHLIANEMSSLTATQRSNLKEQLRRKFGPTSFVGRSPLLTREELADLCKYGMEIGNHTNSHVHCRSLDPTEITAEIECAKTELEKMSGQKVRAFALPYGNQRDLTPMLLRTLRSTSHEAIFLVGAKSNYIRPADDIWYRVSLSGKPLHPLSRTLSVFPILRSLRDILQWK